ncbi:hypothetical protein AArc1_2922 [Natrarchaeobaculum sulfurireducens]|uniref:Uncharacterized protein n=1 Tax=Natrarchaeobaculum sulfurireducens TaxID=2044521 RepID=A0A346PI86_9EURY|nr:hypothetical protein AArc1_2922 [Natrarchaeobaculum sulfurireducens]
MLENSQRTTSSAADLSSAARTEPLGRRNRFVTPLALVGLDETTHREPPSSSA